MTSRLLNEDPALRAVEQGFHTLRKNDYGPSVQRLQQALTYAEFPTFDPLRSFFRERKPQFVDSEPTTRRTSEASQFTRKWLIVSS